MRVDRAPQASPSSLPLPTSQYHPVAADDDEDNDDNDLTASQNHQIALDDGDDDYKIEGSAF